MTVEEAKKLLGDDVKGLSDKEFLKDIELADFFKDVFFDFYKKDLINTKRMVKKNNV